MPPRDQKYRASPRRLYHQGCALWSRRILGHSLVDQIGGRKITITKQNFNSFVFILKLLDKISKHFLHTNQKYSSRVSTHTPPKTESTTLKKELKFKAQFNQTPSIQYTSTTTNQRTRERQNAVYTPSSSHIRVAALFQSSDKSASHATCILYDTAHTARIADIGAFLSK